nr:hypothetical protein [Candidatus Sigynarchaeota archaeon]
SDTLYIIELNPAIKFDDVYVGMPVKVKWKNVTEGNLGDLEYYDRLEDPTENVELLKVDE